MTKNTLNSHWRGYSVIEAAGVLLYPRGGQHPDYASLAKSFRDRADACRSGGDTDDAELWDDAALEAERNL